MRSKLAPVLALVAVALAAAWLVRGPEREGGVATASEAADAPAEREAAVLADAPAQAESEPGAPDEPAPGTAREELARPASAEPAAPEVPEMLGEPCVLHGWLRDLRGNVLAGPGFEVRVWDEDGKRRRAEVSPEGAYRIEALAPGATWVVARGHGWNGREEEIGVRAGMESIALDLVLVPQTRIRVDAHADDGRPLIAALEEERLFAKLRAAATEAPVAALEVDTALVVSEFQLAPRGDDPWIVGYLELPRPQSLHVSLLLRDVVLAERPVAAGADEAVFRVSLDDVRRRVTLVRLRVVDAQTGLPVDSAVVTLEDNSVWVLDEEDAGVLEAQQPIGVTSVRVVAQGYEEHAAAHTLTEGPVNDLGDIGLEGAFVVRGRVVPPPGVDLDLTRLGVTSDRLPEPDEPAGNDNIYFGRACAADGSFEMTLGSGRHRLWCDAYAEDGSLSTGNHVVDTREGPVEDLELVLLRERRLLLRPTPSFPPRTRLEVRDAHGIGIADHVLEGLRPHPLDLPPGVYRVRLSEEEGSWAQTLEVTLGPADVELPVGP